MHISKLDLSGLAPLDRKIPSASLKAARMRRVMEAELGELRARMRRPGTEGGAEHTLLSQPAPADSVVRDKIDEIEVALSREWVRGHRGSHHCNGRGAVPSTNSGFLLSATDLLERGWPAAEASLLRLIASPSPAGLSVEPWLALLGGYKAVDQYDRFIQISVAYSRRFGGAPALGWSAMRVVWHIHGAITPQCLPVPYYVWQGSGELSGVELDALDRLLRADVSFNQIVLDWSQISCITMGQMQVLRGIVHRVRFQRRKYIHIGVKHLIGLVEEHRANNGDSSLAGELHLELLRWLGLEEAFECATSGDRSTYGFAAHHWHDPVFESWAEEFSLPEERSCVKVLSDELSVSNPGQLLGLYDFPPGPGTVVRVNCRRLVRLDADCTHVFRRWIQDCSSHGASIFVQDLHPLLALSVMGIAGV